MPYAEVAKLVYALVLGTSVERHASSSLALGTIFLISPNALSFGLFMYSTIRVSLDILFHTIF